MLHGTLAFLGGILYLSGLHWLPDAHWCLFLPCLLWLAYFNPRLRLVALFLSGILWGLVQAQLHFSHVLSPDLEGRDLTVSGSVEGMPGSNARGTRFLLRVQEVSGRFPGRGFPRRIRLNWYQPAPTLVPGQYLRLVVRLKRPTGFSNPHGFDYEAWLFSQGIQATGYVRGALVDTAPAEPPRGGLDTLRMRLAQRIEGVLDDRTGRPLIMALTLGLRDGITDRLWEVLRNTGTTHLMAISGLHVGLVAGFAFLMVRGVWSLIPRACLYLPATRAAVLPALLAALLYAAMAGFSLPTQRALAMLMVVLLIRLQGRPISIGHTLAFSLGLILVLDPWSVLSASFWLSFGAVALIGAGMGGRMGVQHTAWWRWGRVHLLLAAGLAPLLIGMSGSFSLVSPVANLVAVPWVSMVVAPLALSGVAVLTVQPVLGGWLLRRASDALELLWPFLELLEGWDPAVAVAHVSPVWLLPAVVWLLAPRGWPSRWLGLAPLLILVWPRLPLPPQGQAWISLLDVGQGLSAVVRTRHHTLVFDTGPGFPGGFNTGTTVLLPYLRGEGIAHIDQLVISHADNDHAGGLDGLLAGLPAKAIVVGGDMQHPGATRCGDGQAWHWDGVRFAFLHPHRAQAGKENNRSCVLQVEANRQRLLLSADIEAPAEAALLQRHGPRLRADILIAPHHGSRSSSSMAFIRAVAPVYTLFPVGYRNRWRFPHTDVQARYRRQHSRLLDTARQGAVRFRLGGEQGVELIERHRTDRRRFWHRRD